MLNGSPAYHITLYFSEPDTRIRTGMTGNVLIITAEHDNAIAVPARLVLDSDGQDFALLRNGGRVINQPVTLGLTGDDGLVEISSGLKAGQKISDF